MAWLARPAELVSSRFNEDPVSVDELENEQGKVHTINLGPLCSHLKAYLYMRAHTFTFS